MAPIAGFEGMNKKLKTTITTDRMRSWIYVTSLQIDTDTDNDIENGANEKEVIGDNLLYF